MALMMINIKSLLLLAIVAIVAVSCAKIFSKGASNGKALAAFAIFPLDISGGCLRGLLDHIVVDQPQLATSAIAARAQYLVHHLRRHGDLTLIGRSHAFLYGADLPVDGGQFRQRKGRGDFRLCRIQILFGCLIGQL